MDGTTGGGIAPAEAAAQPAHRGGPGKRGQEVAFEQRRLVEYTEEAIIAELRRVAGLVEHPVMSCYRFARFGRVSYQVVLDRFGSWANALDCAGLRHRHSGRIFDVSVARVSAGMSDDALLAALRAVGEARGDGNIASVDLARDPRLSMAVLKRRFGSWRAAVARAGFAIAKSGRRYTDRECFDNMMALWRHFGRAPTPDEIKRPPSRVGITAYLNRYGSWRRAIAAFVSGARVAAGGAPAPGRARSLPEDRRRVGAVLRLKVLERDGFRCMACGQSPVTQPGCKLHVDHIVPWSRGGRTVLENLRSLCWMCNLGRGDQ